MLHDGLYEQVINKGLDSELVSADKLSQTAPIDTAEASKVLAKYVAEVVERDELLTTFTDARWLGNIDLATIRVDGTLTFRFQNGNEVIV